MAIFKYKNTDGIWEIFESPGAVKYFKQNLTDEEKAQARANIGAASEQNDEAITGIGLPEISEADNGKVLGVVDGKWQKMEIEVSGEGGNNSSSVQPDYTQNDETAADYIKNRPFYKSDPIQTEMLPATSLPFTYDSSWEAFIYAVTPTTEQLEIWQSYWETATIIWGEETFVCEPQYFNGIKLVGNLPAMLGTGNNNIPFVIGIDNSSGQFLVASIVDTAETNRNVSVSVELIMINTLDSKFLGDVPWDKVTDKPFGDIPVGTVVLEESVTVGSVNATESEGLAFINSLKSDLIVPDATYSVTIDDTEYNGTYELFEDVDPMITVVDSNGTQIIAIVGGANMKLLITDSTKFPNGNTYDVKVVLASIVTAKIDSKYLPEISILPSVTMDDSGKTLVVSAEGKWTVGESTGGSGECNLPEVDEGSKVSILSETKLEGFYFLSHYGMYGRASSSIIIGLSAGDTCNIVWDGEKHTCTVVDMSSVMSGAFGLGNLSFAGVESNNEPFAIGFFADGGVTFLSTTDEAEGNSHTVEIYQDTPSTDEGKFLQVVNGKWTAVTIEFAEGGGF